MEISYQLTEDDYRQGYKAFRRRTKYSLWVSRISYLVFFLIFATALLLSIFGPDRSFHNLAPLWAFAAFWVCCIWYAPRRIARKMISGSPSAALPHTVDLSDTGLYFRTSASDSRMTWDIFTGWAEVERVFALFPSPLSFLTIPKRAMTELQQNEMRTLLQNKVSGRK